MFVNLLDNIQVLCKHPGLNKEVIGDNLCSCVQRCNSNWLYLPLQKAIELNPTDPTSQHLLGLW